MPQVSVSVWSSESELKADVPENANLFLYCQVLHQWVQLLPTALHHLITNVTNDKLLFFHPCPYRPLPLRLSRINVVTFCHQVSQPSGRVVENLQVTAEVVFEPSNYTQVISLTDDGDRGEDWAEAPSVVFKNSNTRSFAKGRTTLT